MDIPPPPGPQQPPGGQYPPPGPYGPYGSYGSYGPYGSYGAHPGQGQAPGPYGYQPWGQGHPPFTPPLPPPPVNGFAIAALVLGILCFLPLIGLILGFIALAQI